MIRGFLLLFYLLFSVFSFSQIQVDSIQTNSGSSLTISATSFNDSLFLKIEAPLSDRGSSYYWLGKKGRLSEIDLSILSSKEIFALSKSSSGVDYYFFNRNSKHIEVSSISISTNRVKSSLSKPVEIGGRFIGAYSDSTLHILTFSKKEKFVLTDTQLRGSAVIDEKKYPISLNLADYSQQNVSFISDQNHLSVMKASALVKIYNRESEVIIVSDNPFNPEKSDGDEIGLYSTNVLRINKLTGKTTTQSRLEKKKGDFRSVLWNDYLVKISFEDNNNGVELSTYHLHDLQLKTIQHLPFSSLINFISSGEDLTRRHGKREVKNWGGVPYILTDTLNNKLVLTIGSYWKIPSRIPAMTYFGLVGAFATIFINGVLNEAGEAYVIQKYNYFIGDLTLDFAELKSGEYPRKNIDEFEINNNLRGIKYDYKGYAKFNGKVYSFYQERKSKSLKILSFR